MANPTSAFGWQMPTSTDLVTDLPADFEVFGQAVDTSLADLKGGTTGQVLSKATNADMDFTWVTTDDANAIQNTIVDAKGDLIAASAADTPARLAVGNNGETLVADSSTATGLRYNPQNALANPVINGGMDIWQRGTSISIAASAGVTYTADRWATATGANQAVTISRQSVSDSTNLPNIQYSMRYQRNSGQTGTSNLTPAQTIETVNSIPFAGKAITLSFYAKAGANYSASANALPVYLYSGTGTDQNILASWTGSATVANGTATLTTTWQRFVITGTVASTATELGLQFYFAPTGTAGANDWFEITGVQIDLGTYTASTAPTFRRTGGTIQGELAACQRYYYKIISTDKNYTAFGHGAGISTTQANLIVPIPISMRTTPSNTIETSNYALSDGVTAYTGGTLTASTISGNPNTMMLIYTHGATTLTQYRPYRIEGNNNTAAYVAFSAEL